MTCQYFKAAAMDVFQRICTSFAQLLQFSKVTGQSSLTGIAFVYPLLIVKSRFCSKCKHQKRDIN